MALDSVKHFDILTSMSDQRINDLIRTCELLEDEGSHNVARVLAICDLLNDRIGALEAKLSEVEKSCSRAANDPDADVKTVSVNSVRWLCPNCFHANAACPSALGQMFGCEKCGTTARVVMSKASNIASCLANGIIPD